MSERYSRIFTSPLNQYTKGSPILWKAGALLQDHSDHTVKAQLKLQNLEQKTIVSVTVSILSYDSFGNPAPTAVSYCYSNLSVELGQDFGSKELIPLSDGNTGIFEINSLDVYLTTSPLGTPPISHGNRCLRQANWKQN